MKFSIFSLFCCKIINNHRVLYLHWTKQIFTYINFRNHQLLNCSFSLKVKYFVSMCWNLLMFNLFKQCFNQETILLICCLLWIKYNANCYLVQFNSLYQLIIADIFNTILCCLCLYTIVCGGQNLNWYIFFDLLHFKWIIIWFGQFSRICLVFWINNLWLVKFKEYTNIWFSSK